MIRAELGLSPDLQIPEVAPRFLPYSKAPVVLRDKNVTTIREMNFSLVPSWSKTPKVKFATHNARLDTILEKPTWKKPFLSKHCLIPMTEFVESITEVGKKFAGNMVRFREANNNLLVAAGIYDEWLNKETGEILESFAILTDEPPPFVAEIGHDRCPIFLNKDSYSNWLTPTSNGKDAVNFLKSHQRSIDFSVEIDRPLKPGWENR